GRRPSARIGGANGDRACYSEARRDATLGHAPHHGRSGHPRELCMAAGQGGGAQAMRAHCRDGFGMRAPQGAVGKREERLRRKRGIEQVSAFVDMRKLLAWLVWDDRLDAEVINAPPLERKARVRKALEDFLREQYWHMDYMLPDGLNPLAGLLDRE